jgi:hypothetical protein
VSAFAFFLLAFFLVTLSTFAQYLAGIQGSVLDPQGDAISGATVTLVNKETNRTQTVTSDASGRLQLPEPATRPLFVVRAGRQLFRMKLALRSFGYPYRVASG